MATLIANVNDNSLYLLCVEEKYNKIYIYIPVNVSYVFWGCKFMLHTQLRMWDINYIQLLVKLKEIIKEMILILEL